MTNVLLVDNDADVLTTMTAALRREGYAVATAGDGPQALARWAAERPDLVLLEGDLPGMDGFEVCRRIRRAGSTPVILLTARRAEADVVRGLQGGADDYVTKPCSPAQVAARMRALLRRCERHASQQPATEARAGDLVLDLQTHAVRKAGVSITLTRLEFRILSLLATNAGLVVPYPRLLEYAWGYHDENTSALLKTHVSHLRRKLALPATGPGSIRAVASVGYSLVRAAAPGLPGARPNAVSRPSTA